MTAVLTDHFKSRGYQILAQRPDSPAFWTAIDGCAQFLYKGFMISLSTAGRSKGACMQPVCVFMPGNDYQDVAKDGFHTVQDAIFWVDEQMLPDTAFYDITNPLRPTTSTYAQCLRKWLMDSDFDAPQFNEAIEKYVAANPDVSKADLIQRLAGVEMTVNDFQLAMKIFNIQE